MTHIETMIRVIDAWDSTPLPKNKDGRLWQMMEEMRQALEEALAKQEQGEPVASDAYNMIDRFLRNNLGDDDYAEYSAALDSLCTPQPKQEQGEPVAWAWWLDSENPEMDKPFVVQYEPLAYSKRRPLIYTTPQQPKQEQGEPVAWAGYNLDDMCEAFDRVIEEHYGRKNPFHDPVNRDAMLALRILRGFVPYMKRYTTTTQAADE